MSQLPRLPTFGLGQRHEAQFPTYDPAMQQSLIDNLLSKGMGGLEYVGQTLDKPGRAVRGLLAGRPGELANLLPFSDTLGWTDPAKATSGRDLLDQAGLVDKGETGFLPWLAGFATDVATDPLTYTGIGALTKAGKANQVAGKLTKGLGNAIGAGDRSVLSFMGQHFGTGNAALGEGIQSGIEGLKATGPVRYARGLFDGRVGGAFSKLGQEVQELKSDLLPEAQRGARVAGMDAREATEGAYQDWLKNYQPTQPFLSPEHQRDVFNQGLRLAAETETGAPAAAMAAGPNGLNPDVWATAQQLKPVASKLLGPKNDLWAKIRDAGGNASEIANHLPRYLDKGAMQGEAKLQQARDLRSGFSSMIHRESAIADVPTPVIEAMLNDPIARGPNAAADIVQKYKAWFETGDPGKNLTKAQELAAFVNEHSEGHLFTPEVTKDYAKYMQHGHATLAGLEAVQEFVGNHLVSAPAAGSIGPAATMPLADAYQRIGSGVYAMNPAEAITYQAKRLGMNPQQLAQMHVPVDVVHAANGMMKVATEPEWAGVVKTAIDTFTQGFKKAVTLPFPSFVSRNLTTGQGINLTSGEIASVGDAVAYGKRFFANMMGWKNPDPVLLRTLEEHGVLNRLNVGQDVAGKVGDSIRPENPLAIRETYGQAAQHAQQPSGLANLLGSDLIGAPGLGAKVDKLPGMQTARTVAGTVMDTGSKANYAAQWANSVPMFEYLTKDKGWDIAAAAKKVKELQFHYSGEAMAPFENEVMKRMIPFYTYQRRVVPFVLKNLAEKPGGAIAQAIRATQEFQQQGQYVPEYLQEGGMAIPFGKEGRYLTGLEMPWERALNSVAIRPTVGGTLARTGEKLLAQANPLISGAYTGMTGREPRTGREISALYSTTGSPMADVVLQHSPATRLLSTARQLGDERKEPWVKAVDLLSGAKITDISGGEAHQKDIEARRVLSEIMKESPNLANHTDFYVPKSQHDKLSPEDVKNMRVWAGLDKSGKEYAKKRAAEMFGAQGL